MRLSLPAIALSVCVSPFGLAGAGPSGDVAKTASPKAVPATAAPSTPPPDAPPSDAAARHAKRTACLKQAKAKKLVGAEKNSFIKDCAAAR
ncbi:MAG TPA: hypothetical protein VN325_12460 [Steroidobacteraceae bacterium]|nr:hypothetical protein [Steroidobacteraceae bacterium]